MKSRVATLVAAGVAAMTLIGVAAPMATAATPSTSAPQSVSISHRGPQALPARFPTHPTTTDITSLHLTPTSPVGAGQRIGMPTGAPIAPAELPDTVRPVTIAGTITRTVESGAGTITKEYLVVDWDLTGGSGAVEISIPNPNGIGFITSYTALDPAGTVRVRTYLPRQTQADLDGRMTYSMPGMIVPDYGQTGIPASLTQDWDLADQRAMDAGGRGYPVGKYANTAYPWWLRADGHLNDGWFTTSADGITIISVPSW